MNSKTKALALLSVILVAVVAGSIVFALQSTAKADPTASVATDAETTPSTVNSVNASDVGLNDGRMAFAMEPRFGMGPRGMDRCFGGFNAVQVSSDFTANVTSIAENDSDVQNLLTQGYNITAINPVISTQIDGNGNVVTKASTADVMLQGTNGRAFVVVDLDQAKVTKIVNFTVTEIDK
jgi:hypothetical protein